MSNRKHASGEPPKLKSAKLIAITSSGGSAIPDQSADASEIVVVKNWVEEVKARVPPLER